MIRVRHYLTERLLSSGGHIGFFIHSGSRGKGYAKEALRLALAELRRLGENRALLTVHSDNTSSIAVIEANEGRLENTVTDPETGKELRRYWIELKSYSLTIYLRAPRRCCVLAKNIYRCSPYQGDPKPEVNGAGQESNRYSTNRSPTTTIGTAAL
jgi:hypothetical protein